MTEDENLEEIINTNKRYLASAKKALFDIQSMIGGEVSLERNSLKNNDRFGSIENIGKSSNFGAYKRTTNGKGWKKLIL